MGGCSGKDEGFWHERAVTSLESCGSDETGNSVKQGSTMNRVVCTLYHV
jgi:hypothetical protein